MVEKLKQVHLNDNYRDWDHDLIPGSVTVWEHIEFFYWLQKLGYDGWYSLDIFPYREDGIEAVELAVKAIIDARNRFRFTFEFVRW